MRRSRHSLSSIRTTRALVAATALTLCAATQPVAVMAQALRPIPSDSIVRFAADPARTGTMSTLMLLDALDASVEPDGTGRRTHRLVLQVLHSSAVAGAAERLFSWQPSRQDLVVDWVRVLRPDGTVISDRPSTDQTGDVTAQMQNPMYVDSRTRRMSLSGVAVNTIVDVQYTVTDRAPWRAGDFLIAWSFSPPGPVHTSQLRVSVPESFSPRINEQNLTFKRAESVVSGRRILEWRVPQPRVVRPEPFAPDSDGVRMSVSVSAPDEWSAVTKWYDALSRPGYVISPAVAARADSVVRGSRSRVDTLRALHRWIAQDIRYVSVSLGLGGYQPRTPTAVLSTGYGDCKDKTTLFVAAARRWGIDARPVLLHLNGVRSAQPVSITRFNHAIAAVAEANGSYTFTDLTAAVIPYGELPESYRGSFGVVVKPDGNADTIRFPTRAPDSTGIYIRLRGELSADGRMRLQLEDTPRGDNAWQLRGTFAAPLDSARRATGLRALSTTYLPDASADSLVVFNGLDFTQVARVSAVLHDGRGARRAGPVWLLHLPAPFRQVAASTANSARDLEALPRRVLPIDATRVVGTRMVDIEYRVTLPEGWTAQVPAPISATSFFGRYESTYRMDGRDLVMRRVLIGQGTGIHPAERIAEVIAWMRAVAIDDHEFITLTPAAPR